MFDFRGILDLNVQAKTGSGNLQRNRIRIYPSEKPDPDLPSRKTGSGSATPEEKYLLSRCEKFDGYYYTQKESIDRVIRRDTSKQGRTGHRNEITNNRQKRCKKDKLAICVEK